LSALVVKVIDDVLNPFAGKGPTPPVDPPTSWTLLAFVRRELPGAAVVADPSSPITPSSLTLVDGIVYGTAALTASNLPLAYTVVSAPSLGGKITMIPSTDANPNHYAFTYLPYQTATTGAATEQFSILISEVTPFDSALAGIPLLGGLAGSILTDLHRVPVLSTLLAPVIGSAVTENYSSTDVLGLTSGNPVAFTYKVPSFDGTLISVNFFPASPGTTGVEPTILDGPGLASAGQTDPLAQYGITGLTPGIGTLRDAGYDVITWDPRGEFASGGTLQLDNPFFEGRDVTAIINWADRLEGGDPRVGMVGGSYGGGIQWVSAATNKQIDAIVPVISWNSLTQSLYPSNVFKSSYGTLLVLDLIETGSRFNKQLYSAILTGDLFGFLTQTAQAVAASSGPTVLVNNITAPALIIQGTVDVLFPLEQAVENEAMLSANKVPVKMLWVCNGHGFCNNPGGIDASTAIADTMAWLNQYVAEGSANTIPNFEWQDQNGTSWTSTNLPSNPAFYGTPITTQEDVTGGRIPIIPLIGGSGPLNAAGFPFSLGDAAKASIAVNDPVTVPADTQVVGAPTVTFTYSGIGTRGVVYAQIVDDATGQVLGNIVTPVRVTLNGKTQTATINLNDIAYSTGANPGDLTVQIVGSATPFLNLISFGTIKVSDVELTLPTAADAVAA
jgi:ABC-2 type transport system ATP-binding protein